MFLRGRLFLARTVEDVNETYRLLLLLVMEESRKQTCIICSANFFLHLDERKRFSLLNHAIRWIVVWSLATSSHG
jgi:hypothetical protein